MECGQTASSTRGICSSIRFTTLTIRPENPPPPWKRNQMDVGMMNSDSQSRKFQSQPQATNFHDRLQYVCTSCLASSKHLDRCTCALLGPNSTQKTGFLCCSISLKYLSRSSTVSMLEPTPANFNTRLRHLDIALGSPPPPTAPNSPNDTYILLHTLGYVDSRRSRRGG